MKKKIISALTSIVMGAAALSAITTANAGQIVYTNQSILFLGDSIISTAYDQDAPYVTTVGKYLGKKVVSIHTSGMTSDEFLAKLKNDTAYISTIKGYNEIVVSIGGNDLIDTLMAVIEEEYPDQYNGTNPYNSLLEIISSVKDEPDADKMLMSLITKMNTALKDEVKNCVDTMKQIDAELKSINPDAKIIYQNLYNPILMSEKELEAYLEGRPSNYKTGYTMIRNLFKNNIMNFNSDALGAIENVKIADVYSSFTEEGTENKFGYSNIYTDITKSTNRDFHPNQLGNHAIAAAVIKAFDEKTENADEVVELYESDYKDMPISGHKAFLNAINVNIGDSNSDNLADAGDASFALATYASISTGETVNLSPAVRISLDTDRNGAIDAIDASTILAHYADIATGGNGIL